MSAPRPPAIIKQKQPGYFRLRFALTAGDLESKDIKALCAITEKYGRGELLCTPRHELEIPFIRESDVDAVLHDIEALAFRVRGLLERPNVVACPGTDHCLTAYVRTKKLCNDLEAFLVSAADEGPLPPELRVALCGCPNDCSHTRLNDIGFIGSMGAREQQKVRGFDLVLGGSSCGDGRLAEHIAFLSSEDVVPTIRDLLEIYRETATEGISFGNQFLELGAEEFSMKLQEKLSQRIWFPAI